MKASVGTAAMLAGLLGASAALADDGFVVDDDIISNPTVPIVDPEFDPIDFRMAWQNGAGELWVAQIDPAVGSIQPPSGKGELVDTDLAPLSATTNGPEWAFGADGARLVYTKQDSSNRLWLAQAREVSPGVWNAHVLQNSVNRYLPIGTPSSNLGPTRIAYFLKNAQVTAQGYRIADDPTTEGIIRLRKVREARWIEDLPLLTATAIVSDVRQIVIHDTETGGDTLVTNGANAKTMPFAWYAPDYGAYMLLSRIGTTHIGIWMKTDSGWELFNTFYLPSPRPFVHSPEPFVYGGKSYLCVVAADDLGDPDTAFPNKPAGPTDIWIAGIDPDNPFFRQVSTSNYEANRVDPEVLTLETGPAVYYTEKLSGLGSYVLRRARTGL